MAERLESWLSYSAAAENSSQNGRSQASATVCLGDLAGTQVCTCSWQHRLTDKQRCSQHSTVIPACEAVVERSQRAGGLPAAKVGHRVTRTVCTSRLRDVCPGANRSGF